MAIKHYNWDAPTLDEHSKRKHKILREYFRQYLLTRCKHPQVGKFRLAVVDGFCGGGKYSCGSSGSPLIFVEVLKEAFTEINTTRAANGMKQVEIECLFIFNDANADAIEILRENVAPLHAAIKAACPELHVEVHYLKKPFEEIYPDIKSMLQTGNYNSVIFNLDQYGSKDVSRETIQDIFSTWKAVEAFLTFSIGTVRTYISMDKEKNSVLTQDEDLLKEIYAITETTILNKQSWLGLVEKIIFDRLSKCAHYVSPFSINNPNGWCYWLIHFANSRRARQVYNNVLHANEDTQIHIGRSGLRMLSYDPAFEQTPYLFSQSSREVAKKELYDDIPRLITEQGDAMNVEEFYSRIYNETPAHSDDIHEMMLANPDVEVLNSDGNARRSAKTISPDDTLRVKSQKSFFPLFLGKEK